MVEGKGRIVKIRISYAWVNSQNDKAPHGVGCYTFDVPEICPETIEPIKAGLVAKHQVYHVTVLSIVKLED